jgi:hypothetical protein
MAMSPAESPGGARRLLLVDLDWSESDLVPALIRDPSVSVVLAGVRVGRLCGLPTTHDLADLTREIFDLALVGARSPRRAQIERLLCALGTPVIDPGGWTAEGHPGRRATDDPGAFSDDLDGAFPDLAAPPMAHDGDGAAPEPPPAAEDTVALERWLARRREVAGAGLVELHTGPHEALERRCRLGAEDPMVDALVTLAARLCAPQVIERLDRPAPRRGCGAWPFRAGGRAWVLAAGGIDALEGPPRWERVVEQLRLAWSATETPSAAPALLPGEAFVARVRLAVERNHRAPFAFSVHRLRLDGPDPAVDAWCDAMPHRLRAADGMCRVTHREALVLFCGTAASYGALRRRMAAAWEDAWRAHGASGPVRPIVDERIALEDPSRAAEFLSATEHWIAAP